MKMIVRGFEYHKRNFYLIERKIDSGYDPAFIAKAALDWPYWEHVYSVRIYTEDLKYILARAVRK